MSVTGVPPGSAGSGGSAPVETNTVLVAPAPGSGVAAGADLPASAIALGPVQCGAAVGCSSVKPSSGCFESVPGGICVDCDAGDACPDGTECAALGQRAERECARPCGDDSGCNLGLSCADGHCVPRRCNDGAECPYPYVSCHEGLCSRPRCDETPCPPELRFAESGFCVEPELVE
jgi:hypothetical protein